MDFGKKANERNGAQPKKFKISKNESWITNHSLQKQAAKSITVLFLRNL